MLIPFLRPDLEEPVRSRRLRALLLGSGGAPDRRRKVHLAPPLPGPGRLLALCAMVRVRGQGRSDRLLLVSPPRAQSLLPPPHCGSSDAVSHEPPTRVRLEKSSTKERATLGQTPVVVCCLLCWSLFVVLCLFVRLFVRSFVRLFVCLFVLCFCFCFCLCRLL